MPVLPVPAIVTLLKISVRLLSASTAIVLWEEELFPTTVIALAGLPGIAFIVNTLLSYETPAGKV